MSISVTITDIWTKFGTEHKYHTTNTLEWPNSHKLKIQDGGSHHLEFWKNVNNFGLDKGILHQIIWEDAPRWRGDDHVTKSRNRKLMCVTLSNDRLKYMCVDLSDYNKLFEPNLVPNTNTTLSTRRNIRLNCLHGAIPIALAASDFPFRLLVDAVTHVLSVFRVCKVP